MEKCLKCQALEKENKLLSGEFAKAYAAELGKASSENIAKHDMQLIADIAKSRIEALTKENAFLKGSGTNALTELLKERDELQAKNLLKAKSATYWHVECLKLQAKLKTAVKALEGIRNAYGTPEATTAREALAKIRGTP